MKRFLIGLLFSLVASSAFAQGLPVCNWGDMIYRSSTGYVCLPFDNTPGKFLRGNGASAAPIWSFQADQNFVLPTQATNTFLGNTTGGNASPTPNTVSNILDTVGYDISRPPTPNSILYKSNVAPNNAWQALQPGTIGQVLTSGGVANPPSWSSVAANSLDSICSTQGSILFRNAAAWVCLAPGTNGQVLTAAGPAANVSWTSTGGRTVLSGPLTMWRRSDGSDANCTGLTNAAYVSGSFPQACAKSTWNTLFVTAATTLDFNGQIVTLQSGTTDTAGSGLFMNTSWFGGGQLVVDLAGSSISETVTKGLINNVVQPGKITIQNSSGLGAGGVISSAGFSCIQNDSPTEMDIGLGITAGQCFDAAFEAIQGGAIYLASGVNIGTNGTPNTGHQMVLTSLGGVFGFNGQPVNFVSNQTYSSATITVNSGGVQAAAVTFNMGGHTVTGKRYDVSLNGYIDTSNSGPTYLPGSVPGTVASGGCYDSTCDGGGGGITALTGDVTASGTGSVVATLANIPTGVPMAGTILGTNIAAPGNPAAGKINIWADSAATTLQAKNSAGQIGTMVATQGAIANQFVTGLSGATGALTLAQPTFANLSGSFTCAQRASLTGDVTASAGSCTTVLTNIPTGTTMAGTILATNIAAPGSPAAGKLNIWADSTTGTLWAKNSSGAPSTTVFTQASAGTFVTGLSSATGAFITGCPSGCTFQSNGTTTAGVVTTAQRWGIGSAVGAQTPTNTTMAVSQNVTAIDAASPGLTTILHVAGPDTTNSAITLDAFGAIPGFSFRRSNGTAAAPTVAVANNVIGAFFGLGYDGSGSKFGYSGEIDFFASETWSNTAHGGGIKFWSNVNGTATQTQSMTLHNSGGFCVGSACADPGINNISTAGVYKVGATSGLSVTKTVRAAGGAADCTLIFTGGLLTGGTC